MAACRSCDAPMIWARIVESGKLIPLNPRADANGNIVVLGTRDETGARLCRVLAHDEDPGPSTPRYLSHFATCPDAPAHRRTA